MRFKIRYILCRIIVSDSQVHEQLVENDLVAAIRVGSSNESLYHVEVT